MSVPFIFPGSEAASSSQSMRLMSVKKISRRDAMKLLGAAIGGAVLSTLPSKWNTPELAAGVLPAHARQSGFSCENLVRTATVDSGGLLGDGFEHFYPLSANFTAAEIDACHFNSIDISWDSGQTVAGGAVYLKLAHNAFTMGVQVDIPIGSTSAFSTNPACWSSSDAPYVSAVLSKTAGSGAILLGTVTITLSPF